MANYLKAACIFLSLFLLGCDGHSKDDRQFDSSAWKATAEGERYVFVDSLIERRILIGKKREEVMRELGQSSSVGEEDGRYSYVIQYDGSGYSRVTILDVKFDGEGRVSQTLIRED
jgi:hypothetical protein